METRARAQQQHRTQLVQTHALHAQRTEAEMVKRQKPERKKLHRFVLQSSTKADKMEKIGGERGGDDGYGMKSKHHQRLAHAHHERTQGSQATYHSST
jgi:hypothetical protein